MLEQGAAARFAVLVLLLMLSRLLFLLAKNDVDEDGASSSLSRLDIKPDKIELLRDGKEEVLVLLALARDMSSLLSSVASVSWRNPCPRIDKMAPPDEIFSLHVRLRCGGADGGGTSHCSDSRDARRKLELRSCRKVRGGRISSFRDRKLDVLLILSRRSAFRLVSSSLTAGGGWLLIDSRRNDMLCCIDALRRTCSIRLLLELFSLSG